MSQLTPGKRRSQALKALKGCKIHKPRPKGRKPTSKGYNAAFDPTKRPKDYQTWKSCSRKARFKSQGDATLHLHKWETQTGCRGRVYFCDICNGWHITIRHSR